MRKNSSRAPEVPVAAIKRGSRIAVLDIGSNNVHLSIMRIGRGAKIQELHDEKTELKLGLAEARHAGLMRRAVERLGGTVARHVRFARRFGVGKILAFATEALREDPRRRAVAEEIGRRAGVTLHMVSAEREAELGFLGARAELKVGQAQLFVDAGGGSTEISLSRGRRRVASGSIPIGNASLSGAVTGDPPGFLELSALRGGVDAMLAEAPRDFMPRSALISGGICDQLALLGSFGPKSLSCAALDRGMRRLLKHPRRKLVKRYGLDPKKSENLAPAIIILGAVLQHYGLREARVTRMGVRQGAALACRAEGETWWKGR